MAYTERDIREAARRTMRRARAESGLTQGEMAAALSRVLSRSIVRTQVVSWEVGRNLPGVGVLLATLAVVPRRRVSVVLAELVAMLDSAAA